MTRTSNITIRKYFLLALLVPVAIVTAIIPNVGQQLYERGILFPVFDQLRNGSYLVFAISLVGAWQILKNSKVKWLLLTLIPVAYFELLLWVVTLFAWSTGGFAP